MSENLAPSTFVLIPCAGQGRRALAALGQESVTQSGLAKQYQLLAGQPMVLHTIEAFLALGSALQGLFVVVSPEDNVFEAVAPDFVAGQGSLLRCGGQTRAASVENGLAAMLASGAAQAHDWIMVHDAARCLITPGLIKSLMRACHSDPLGGLLAQPLADTLKAGAPGAAGASHVKATLARDGKWLAQTPQMFRIGALHQALVQARQQGLEITDESSAMEVQGGLPRLVPGSALNFKVTYPEDFELAEAVLLGRQLQGQHQGQHQGQRQAPSHPNPLFQTMTVSAPRPALSFRIGEGWDTHALVAGRKLILGGVEVPHTVGLLGHSDADVLLHAITDALLGAAGLGDIGRHFPDTDAQFKGADSMLLLAEAARRVRNEGWVIANVDSTVIAQAPKLAPYIDTMRRSIATGLSLAVQQVNVKAKTAEKMGPVGEGRAMEARAVVLLQAG